MPATPAPAGTTPRADLLPDIPVRRATPPPAVDRPAPERLTIGTGDEAIVMPVDPVGVADDGSMELPPDADRAGWYRYGQAPGAPSGHTVLAAHVDSRLTGIGPLADLDEVEPGTVVTVRTADGTQHRYRTTDVVRLAKDDAPVSAWFAREGPERLVVITCGGRGTPR
ncbi:class F sortase [Cellulomonas sp.]|uniref:class F sortase n=1 Tax=Cellulomonas sp. TaxID=40001 RepID=UPI002584C761|nr:class F sortase [Cellulomonas sp.]MCR6688626.1 class F sortase [Cellulomonas sp.]